MMNQENCCQRPECKCVSKCISWRPILAGALVAVGFSFLLNLFSVAIGLTAFTTNKEGSEIIVFGGLFGTAIGIVASMFVAGWISGYLGIRYCSMRHLGALYGFLTWCVALIIAIFLASHAQSYITFYSHVLSGTTETLQVSSATVAAGKMTATVSNVSATKLVISTYILFCLFFLSAFACSLGGHCGMRYVSKENCCK
jgi:hypothetical protein